MGAWYLCWVRVLFFGADDTLRELSGGIHLIVVTVVRCICAYTGASRGSGEASAAPAPLWGKGDCVELIVKLGALPSQQVGSGGSGSGAAPSGGTGSTRGSSGESGGCMILKVGWLQWPGQ